MGAEPAWIGTPNHVQIYLLVTEVDIGLVARELLAGRIVQESPRLLQCDCPNHKSQSHRSLHVMLDKQGWYCFGCGVGGDVLQLVEFVRFGVVTRGQSGPMPESHQQARDFLAAKAGFPVVQLRVVAGANGRGRIGADVGTRVQRS